ncbi:MAG TPA: hypothetical protein PLA71_00390 [Saccharofermentans sp.]|nr:hypothetical protein [Saccharofermentans sp.]
MTDGVLNLGIDRRIDKRSSFQRGLACKEASVGGWSLDGVDKITWRGLLS